MKKISPYEQMAYYYDWILQYVDYDCWYEYLNKLMHRYHPAPKKILELGCGTGKFGAKFSRDGYDIIGMDLSESMLDVARNRIRKNFQVFQGDLLNFRVKPVFDFIFCVHDTLNYMLTPDDVLKALTNIHDSMNDKTCFMCDFTTEYNVKRYFEGEASEHIKRETRIVWNNDYDSKKKIISSKLVFTLNDGSTFEEIHRQRIYTPEELLPLFKKAGLTIIDVFSDYTFKPINKKTIMMNFICKRAD